MKNIFLVLLTAILFNCQKIQNKTNSISGKNENNMSESDKNQDVKFASAEGPFGKFDPPVSIHKFLQSSPTDRFANGDSWDDNVYSRGLLKELGIKVEWLWQTKSHSDYITKLNTSIASGDFADAFSADPDLYYKLAKKGVLLDLTQAYKKFASPKLKGMIEKPYNGFFYNNIAKVDGRLFGISRGSFFLNSAFQIGGLRKDWLDKLGLKMPKTADDLYNIMVAFANDDPDGDGQKNTLGLAAASNLLTGLSNAFGIFEMYGSKPKMWVRQGDKIIYGSLTDNTKKALKKLAELYSKDVLDKDYFAKNSWDRGSVLVKPNPGVITGVAWMAEHLQANKTAYPDANWVFFEIPDENGDPIKNYLPMGGGSFLVSQKSFKHPDAIIKLANFVSEKYENDQDYAGFFDETGAFFDNVGIAGGYAGEAIDPYKEVNIAKKTWKALKTGDVSNLNGLGLSKYKQAKKYIDEGDPSNYGEYLYLKPDSGTMALSLKIYKEGRYEMPPYYGQTTKLQLKYMPSIKSKFDELMVRMITGDMSVDDGMDEFREFYYQHGGKDIDAEINKWYNTHPRLKK